MWRVAIGLLLVVVEATAPLVTVPNELVSTEQGDHELNDIPSHLRCAGLAQMYRQAVESVAMGDTSLCFAVTLLAESAAIAIGVALTPIAKRTLQSQRVLLRL